MGNGKCGVNIKIPLSLSAPFGHAGLTLARDSASPEINKLTTMTNEEPTAIPAISLRVTQTGVEYSRNDNGSPRAIVE